MLFRSLVVLEGFAAGIPSITTDVGSCRQLIEGFTEGDRALGSAGTVVPIANPAAFAQAVVALLNDDARWQAAQQAGLARVRRYYTKAQMTDSYRALYNQLAAAPDVAHGKRGGATGGCPVNHGAPAGARAAQTGGAR